MEAYTACYTHRAYASSHKYIFSIFVQIICRQQMVQPVWSNKHILVYFYNTCISMLFDENILRLHNRRDKPSGTTMHNINMIILF